mmetsp:Transcript_4469/g.10850  ORF Transcript_4469/g.10850 Transcript_4469/m.10850 type:complete len:245 (+) Transcript_4469:281-1015(+)
MGREVQLSFYAGPSSYDPAECGASTPWGQAWPWNPIGAGDVDGNHGQILSLEHNDTDLHVVSRPLQWACKNVSCECVFEQTLHLDGTALWVHNVLRNNRSDHVDYGAFGQELPAAYSIGELYRLVSYTGDQPWTSGALTDFKNASGPPWVPGIFSATESWAALVDANGWGFGVFSPNITQFNGGFSGAKGHGGPQDDPTGYIAPFAKVDLAWNAVFEFDFALVLGDLDTIRSYAEQHHHTGVIR